MDGPVVDPITSGILPDRVCKKICMCTYLSCLSRLLSLPRLFLSCSLALFFNILTCSVSSRVRI